MSLHFHGFFLISHISATKCWSNYYEHLINFSLGFISHPWKLWVFPGQLLIVWTHKAGRRLYSWHVSDLTFLHIKPFRIIIFCGGLDLWQHTDVSISPTEKKIRYTVLKIELNWSHRMMIEKQCCISDDLSTALSLATSPLASTLWISSLAFPLFEVSGSSELRKVTQSTEGHKYKAVWLSALARIMG